MKPRKIPDYDDPEYRRRREKEFRSRARMVGHENLETFDGLIAHARQGNTKPLCSYLRSDKPLSRDDREHLAWLIDRIAQHGRKGRRPGSAHPTNKHIYAAALVVLREQSKWRAGSRRTYVPKAETDKMIRQVISRMEFPKNDRSLPDSIANAMRRPRSYLERMAGRSVRRIDSDRKRQERKVKPSP